MFPQGGEGIERFQEATFLAGPAGLRSLEGKQLLGGSDQGNLQGLERVDRSPV